MRDYRFDHKDWVSPHVKSWEQILSHIDPCEPHKFLEIGCFEGRSTVWFIDNFMHHPASKMICVDTWEGGEEVKRTNLPFDFKKIERNFQHNIASSSYPLKIEIHKGNSIDRMLSLTKQTGWLTAAYIDGSHVAKDVLWDTMLIYRCLKPGGVIIFDDYKNAMATSNMNLRVGPAVDMFVKLFSDEITFGTTNSGQAFLKKK